MYITDSTNCYGEDLFKLIEKKINFFKLHR